MTYEAMFLFDPALSADWAAVEAEVRRLLERTDATVLGIKNWEERRLAYPIRQHKRAQYVLAYFSAPQEKIAHLERDIHLSEKIIRAQVIRREKFKTEEMDKAFKEIPSSKPVVREEFGGRGEFGDRGDHRGPRTRRPPEEEMAPVGMAMGALDGEDL